MTDFDDTFSGRILQPGHPEFDVERRVWNGLFDRVPAVVAQCAGVADVVAAVRYARERELPISVRGGGHSHDGLSVGEGAVVIDLQPMKTVLPSPDRSTVTVGAGARWRDVNNQLIPAGLLVAGGTVASVGVSGFTMGGGLGWLLRSYGATCSTLASVDAVTVDGEFVHAGPGENEDLFWAVRGGHGNYAVVTNFEFNAYPSLGRNLSGRITHIGTDKAAAAIRHWRDFMEDAPRALGTVLSISRLPAIPSVPVEHHGEVSVTFMVFHSGDVEQAREDLRPLAEWGSPAKVDLEPRTLNEFLDLNTGVLGQQFQINSDARWHSTTGYMDSYSDSLVDLMVEEILNGPVGASGHPERDFLHVPILTVPRLGGKAAETPKGSMAYTIDSPFIYQLLTNWSDPAHDELWMSWGDRVSAAFDEHDVRDERYLNFVTDTGTDVVRTGLGPAVYDRLAEIKQTWDPENVLSSTKNVVPSAVPSGTAVGS